MVFLRHWRKGKLTSPLFLSMLFLLLAALIVGCAPGGSKSAPAAAPIVIGFPVSMNTPEKDAYLAAQMAADEINSKDGGIVIDGVKRTLKVVSTDTRDLEPNVPSQDSILAVQNLISDQKPAAIVSAVIRSEIQLAIMQNTASTKLVQILCGGVNSTFKKNFAADPAKFKYQFKNSPTDVDLVVALMSTCAYVKQTYGFTKIYLFGEDVDFARAGVTVAQGLLQKAGWEISGVSFIPLGTTDYSSIMSKFRDSGAQVGFYLFSTEGAPMPKQYQAMGLKQLMLGSSSAFFGEKTWDQTQGACENFCIAVNGAGNAPSPKLAKTQAFYDAFVKQNGRGVASSLGVSQSYDGVYMLAQAWKALGTFDPDKVVAYLEATPYDGVVGHTAFTAADHQAPYGNDPTKVLIQEMVQWQNKQRAVVFPLEAADSTLAIPK